MTEKTYCAMRGAVYAARSDADREGTPQATCVYVGTDQFAEITFGAHPREVNSGAPRLKWLGLRVFRVDDTSHFELNRT